jgi:transposase-like protein
METTDTSRSKTAESGSDGEASRGAQSDGAKGTRRKLNDQQEREVTRLYAETETPVSEISKRFGIGESSVYRVAQRHGAALRGRTATASSSRPAAKTAAKAATAGRAGRGRAATKTATKTAAKTAAKSTAKTAAKTTAKTAAKSAAKTAAKTPSTNGRRTPALRGRPAATPAKRASATTTRATRGPRLPRAAVVAVTRRQFRVSYTAVRVFVASNMADAIRQAEAAGATDITGIERSS